MALNPKAQSLLLNICKLYAASPSQTVFSTDTPVLLNYSNSFFYELENAGYITFTDMITAIVPTEISITMIKHTMFKISVPVSTFFPPFFNLKAISQLEKTL